MQNGEHENPDFDPLIDEVPGRYIVGIDLGTTNCAVTAVDSEACDTQASDTQASDVEVTVFPVQQLIAASRIESRETLPSFHFQPSPAQIEGDSLRMPWDRKTPSHYVGEFARDETATTSGRGIASAKSWLCHQGVDRRADLLPWHATDEVRRLSPVEATASYLRQIRGAWNHQHPDFPLEEQDVVVTLPASFDEVARELTVEAAANAGLHRIMLIEEPQAAFYAWINKHRDSWEDHVNVGQKILVCDIGGGTSDFTLIRVRVSDKTDAAESESSDQQKVQFHRVAVGNHLILGGDNLDLALAKHLESKISSGKRLAPRQWDVLVGLARKAKETLLGADAPDKTSVTLPGTGSKLVGGSLQTELTRAEVESILVDGFLPHVALDDRPAQGASGFQEFGLPYAPDPAITRYLAVFLTAHRDQQTAKTKTENATGDLSAIRPDVVLFNGGFFESPILRQRIIEVLQSWFRDKNDPAWEPQILQHDRLDMAVARGATYYGMVRRGTGVRIAASLARSYYISVETNDNSESDSNAGQGQAICLVPGEAEAGQDFILTDRTFHLTLSQPVEFLLYVSSTRLIDEPGELIPIDREQMKPLPPIRTVMRAESRNEKRDIAVQLHVHLTEIGTIELSCHEVDSERSWKLQFDIRSTTQTDVAAHSGAGEAEGFVSEDVWQQCETHISNVFSRDEPGKPRELVSLLTDSLGMPREEWPMSLLRRIWEHLMSCEPGRRISAAHEARWLNLLGYSLRPGYGFAVDDWRVTETWRHVNGKLAHGTPDIRRESLILWRRIAGGLSRGQQISIADPLLSSLRSVHKKLTGGKSSGATMRAEDTVEVWRLLGSLELLDITRKVEIGGLIVDLVAKPSMAAARDAMIWTLGRTGQRVPLYGPLNTVVPVEHVQKWLPVLMQQTENKRTANLALVQLGRRIDDRYRDISDADRAGIVKHLRSNQATPHLVRLVEEGGNLDAEEQTRAFGEALPKGLRLE